NASRDAAHLPRVDSAGRTRREWLSHCSLRGRAGSLRHEREDFTAGGQWRPMKVKTQSKKVNKSWLNDHVNDPWVKLANKEGYRARAAYKLKEIDEVFGLIRPGHLVVDLGSATGAWSQYGTRKL